MNKPHLVEMVENAYKHHITDSTGLHIERFQLAFEIAIMDKTLFLSRFISEIVPRIQETINNSSIQQKSVSTADGRWVSVEKSDVHEVQVESNDAEIVAMIASLSSFSTINRYLSPDNPNLLQGRVYIPETVMVASSSKKHKESIYCSYSWPHMFNYSCACSWSITEF